MKKISTLLFSVFACSQLFAQGFQTADSEYSTDPVLTEHQPTVSSTVNEVTATVERSTEEFTPRRTWLAGIRLGVNSNTWSTENTFLNYEKRRIGLHGGVFLDYQSQSYTLQTGIAYYLSGSGIEGSDDNATLHYLEIPFRWNIHLFQHEIAGESQYVRLVLEPYGAFALDGSIGDAEVVFDEADSGIKRFDYGFRSGVSLEVACFDISLVYQLGIRNISNLPSSEIHNRALLLQVMYLFGK